MSATAGIGRMNSITTDVASCSALEVPIRTPAATPITIAMASPSRYASSVTPISPDERPLRQLVVERAERRRRRRDALLVVERADAGLHEQRHEHDEEPARDVHPLHATGLSRALTLSTSNNAFVRGPIRYAQSGDVSIAYQVVGDGPFDLVHIPGLVSHLEHDWEEPRYAAFLERLASFSRLILLDKRGTGMSDRHGGVADLETRMDDVRAVMDAAGSERAALFAYWEGGPMAVLFAATYPQRTRALVLASTFARPAFRRHDRGAARRNHRSARQQLGQRGADRSVRP